MKFFVVRLNTIATSILMPSSLESLRMPTTTATAGPRKFPLVPAFHEDTDEDHSINLQNMVGKARPLRSPPALEETLPTRTSVFENTSNSRCVVNGSSNRRIEVEKEISMTLNGQVDKDLDEQELNQSYHEFLRNINNGDFYDSHDDDDSGQDEDFDVSEENTYFEGISDEYQSECEYESDVGSNAGAGADDFFKQKGQQARNSPGLVPTPKLSQIESPEQPAADSRKPRSPSASTSPSVSLHYWTFALVAFLLSCVIAFAVLILQQESPQFFKTISISNKISQLEDQLRDNIMSMETRFEKLKSELTNLSVVGSGEAVTLEDGHVRIAPEFHQFLNKFLDSYQSSYIDEKLEKLKQFENPENLEKLADLQALKDYVDKAIVDSTSEIKNDIQNEIKSEVSSFMDNLNIVNDTLHPPSNKIWLNSMLELISKSAKHKNYADFAEGARILGFLTPQPQSQTGIFHTLQNWFANDVSSPHNANHVILDDEVTWQGGDQLGIRLSSPIIPTDILIQTGALPREGNEDTQVSIGFKPDSKVGFDKLKFDVIESKNKYVSKYKVLKSNRVKPQSINHIKLPIRFINSQVAGSNLYFLFNHAVNVSNIKVYGVTDVDTVHFKHQLDLLVDKFNEDDTVHHHQQQQQSADEAVYDINEDIYL
ncbi:uncharacterized protein LODBEIA_P51230 [Lodderomyces beijingensis]|uniref:SUN domain-containing protein n=1 Tax=Lodderomyces beijingensis TaxID=1775926 RepID=A0ABP0ZS06_9ASCO